MLKYLIQPFSKQAFKLSSNSLNLSRHLTTTTTPSNSNTAYQSEGKKEENAAEVSLYKIIVTNANTAQDKTVSLFQQKPNAGNWQNLVWSQHSIEKNGGSGTFSFELSWELSWGQSEGKLGPGVMFTGEGSKIAVDPNLDNKSNNGAKISYNAKSKLWNISPAAFPEIPVGSLAIQTDNSFTSAQALAENFAVDVLIYGSPVFAQPGGPNTIYRYDIHPTYYLALTGSTVSSVVTEFDTSIATQVTFADGVTTINCTINENNEIVVVQ